MKKYLLFFFMIISTYAFAGDYDCSRSLCGCWIDEVLVYETTVKSAEGPVCGIEVYCDEEEIPFVVSDINGAIYFSLEVESSPGCGYKRCNKLKFVDPIGDYEGLSTNIKHSHKKEIFLVGGRD